VKKTHFHRLIPAGTRKFGSQLRKEQLLGAPLCSALFSGAARSVAPALVDLYAEREGLALSRFF